MQLFIHSFIHSFSELVKDAFRSYNIKNGGTIIAEQKYAPLTTRRRNEALKARKVLKANNQIINGYVALPAKLMVRSEQGAKYHMHKDFSDIDVIFKKLK